MFRVSHEVTAQGPPRLGSTGSFAEKLFGTFSRFCSHCSRVWGGYRGAVSAFLLIFRARRRVGGDEEEQLTPEETLALIEQIRDPSQRLQYYDPDKRELWYACGDGRNCVFVSSEGELKRSAVTFRTKLTREVVGRFLAANEKPGGKRLLREIITLLRRYLG